LYKKGLVQEQSKQSIISTKREREEKIMKAKMLVLGIVFLLLGIANAHAEEAYKITFTCSPSTAAITIRYRTLKHNALPNNLCVYAIGGDMQLPVHDDSILTRVAHISWESNIATAHLADGTTLKFPWGFASGHKLTERVSFEGTYYVSIFQLFQNNKTVRIYYPDGYEVKFFNAFETLFFQSAHINIVPIPK